MKARNAEGQADKPRPGHLHPPSELPDGLVNSVVCQPARTCLKTLLDEELGRRFLEWVPGPSLVSWLADPCLGPWRLSLLPWALGCVDGQGASGVLGPTPLTSHSLDSLTRSIQAVFAEER